MCCGRASESGDAELAGWQCMFARCIVEKYVLSLSQMDTSSGGLAFVRMGVWRLSSVFMSDGCIFTVFSCVVS